MKQRYSKAQEHNIIFRAFFTWLLFIPVVFLNATVRELVYKPLIGGLAAHQISTVIGSVAFLTLAYFHLRHYVQGVNKNRLFGIGFMWVLLTILFEFGLGRLVTGASWDKLFYDYNILEGRIWILLLLTLSLTPFIVKHMVSDNTEYHQFTE